MLSLRNYLISILLLLVSVPMLLFWAWPHSSALQHGLDEVRDRHLLIARNLSAALERYHRDAQTTFDFTADALTQKVQLPDSYVLLKNLHFKHICLLDSSNGNTISGLAGHTPCPTSMGPNALAFARGIDGDDKTVMSSVLADGDGAPHMLFATKLGKHLVIGAIDTRYFVELGKAVAFGIKGHAVIVDQSGKALAHPFPAWETEMRDLSKISTVKLMLAGGQGVDKFYSPAFKDDMVAGYTHVKGPGWGVMVPQPLAELRETANRLQLAMFLVFAIGFAVAALAAYLIASLLARPVAEVIAGVRKMACGTGDVRIPVLGRNYPREFIELTTTFNTMADRVTTARAAEAEAQKAADAANAQLQEKLVLLERSNRDLNEFAHVAAHDLQEPLRKIEAYNGRIAARYNAVLPAEGQMFVERVQDATGRMRRLITDLLGYARLNAGRDAFKSVALNEIAAEVMSDLQVRIEETQATVRTADLPVIEAHASQMRQLMQNIIANALKFSKPGVAPIITVSSQEVVDPVTGAASVQIAIADNGIGFENTYKEQVFKIFQRLHGRSQYEGTGVGLATCRRIAETHNGSITADSRLGEGTTFTITLPLRQAPATATPVPVVEPVPRDRTAASLQQAA